MCFHLLPAFLRRFYARAERRGEIWNNWRRRGGRFRLCCYVCTLLRGAGHGGPDPRGPVFPEHRPFGELRKIKNIIHLYSSKNYIILTGRETRTLTHKARDPKSRASTNSAIPAFFRSRFFLPTPKTPSYLRYEPPPAGGSMGHVYAVVSSCL